MEQNKPNIIILATGGTIAGVAQAHTQTIDYKSGVLDIKTLMSPILKLINFAHVKWEQIANIDSADMTYDIWLKLAKRVNILLKSPEVDGIVITHGSDTMEESAFFLHLVVASSKPVVLTGAMRPSTAIGADGVKNLYDAIALAADIDAKGRGVMIVMNDRIQSARYAIKNHTFNIDAFASPNIGDMGYILDSKAYFYYAPIPPHTDKSVFRVDSLTELPKVDILYSYVNDGSSIAAEAFYKAGTRGIVVAGSGAGNIHSYQKDTLIKLMQKGLVVVQSSRVGAGVVHTNEQDSMLGFIGAKDLNPQKARVLLLLALTKTDNLQEIADFFEEY